MRNHSITKLLATIFLLFKLDMCLICNGNFEQYGVVAIPNWIVNSKLNSNYSCWYNLNGGVFQVKAIWSPYSTAIAELSHDYPYVLCQDLHLLVNNTYNLTFDIFHYVEVLRSTVFVVLNNEFVFNYTTVNNFNFTKASFTFMAGTNLTQLCFQSIQIVNPPNSTGAATCLDNITLTWVSGPPNVTNATNTTNQITNITAPISIAQLNSTDQTELKATLSKIFTSVISLPMKLVIMFRQVCYYINDLWLYTYNPRNYTGPIRTTFETISQIEQFKFQYLEKYFNWSKYKSELRLSNYTAYSTPEFVKVEHTSSVFIDCNFSFFVYTLSQNVLFCLALHIMLRVVRGCSLDQHIKKFHFLKTVLAIAIFQQNLDYFLFVSFSHLHHSFSFTWTDKASLIFTLVFLFGLVIFCCSFYLLIHKYLGPSASNFSDITRRKFSGFMYKTLYLILRNGMRSIVFCFFHHEYEKLLLLLSIIEAVVIANTIFIQLYYRIFVSKITFNLTILYSTIFILLNFTLILEEVFREKQLQELIKKCQQILLYSMIGILILSVIASNHSQTKQKNGNPIVKIKTNNYKPKTQHKHLEKNKIRCEIKVENDLDRSPQKFIKSLHKNGEMKKIDGTLFVKIVEKRSKKIKRSPKANIPVASKFIEEKHKNSQN